MQGIYESGILQQGGDTVVPILWISNSLTRICCVEVQSCWGLLRDNRPLNFSPFFCLWQHWLEGSSCNPWWRCLLQRAPVRTPAGLKSVNSSSWVALTWQESGYDQPAGSQSFTVLLTDVQLALYHKAPLLWLTLGPLFLLSWPFNSIGKASLGIQIWVLLASVCRETSCIAALFKSSMHCMRQCVLCRTSNDVTRIAVFTSFQMFSNFRECFVGLIRIVCTASWHLCTLTDFGSPLQIHDQQMQWHLTSATSSSWINDI